MHLLTLTHLLFCLHTGHSHEITGILCNNITLKFILNDTITKSSHFAVYRSGLKIAECSSNCTAPDGCNVHRGKVSVFFNISNLKLNHSGTYYATLFLDTKLPKESNRVELRVQEDNSSCTGKIRLYLIIGQTSRKLHQYRNINGKTLWSVQNTKTNLFVP